MEELVEALPEELSVVYLQRLNWIKVWCGMAAWTGRVVEIYVIICHTGCMQCGIN